MALQFQYYNAAAYKKSKDKNRRPGTMPVARLGQHRGSIPPSIEELNQRQQEAQTTGSRREQHPCMTQVDSVHQKLTFAATAGDIGPGMADVPAAGCAYRQDVDEQANTAAASTVRGTGATQARNVARNEQNEYRPTPSDPGLASANNSNLLEYLSEEDSCTTAGSMNADSAVSSTMGTPVPAAVEYVCFGDPANDSKSTDNYGQSKGGESPGEWEVIGIIGQEVVDDETLYLVEWKPTWEPVGNLAPSLLKAWKAKIQGGHQKGLSRERIQKPGKRRATSSNLKRATEI